MVGKAQRYKLKFKILLFTSFSLFIICCSLFVLSANAAGEFDVAYDITYQIESDGSAKVVSDISLTNKLSNVYATEYNLVVEKGEISKVGAWDSQGKIETKIQKGKEQTKINLTFNDQVAGVGKTLRFTLKYELANLAKKSGEVWQVVLPRQADLERFSAFELVLKIPNSFPDLAYVSPLPTHQSKTKDFRLYSFSKQSLGKQGVVAAFGQFQVFDFSLSYYLNNPKTQTVFTKIALPPTTPYQQVFYDKIEPLPENVEQDGDGNWLATYLLSPRQEIEVVAQGQARIYAQPGEKPPLQKVDLKKYLAAQPFWEVDDPEIQSLASKLKTPRSIYNYVVQTLSYDFENISVQRERMGALGALKSPKEAICMEFTDLFVALARAAGIPAREVNGFAYTDNPKLKPLSEKADILHAWPEYWDEEQKRWIPVDPTWEKTSSIDYFHKLDLSHFVFVIHGGDSQYPASAGSYKKDNQGGKDIKIDFGTFEEEKESQLEVQFLLPKSYFGERGVSGKIVLQNLGPRAFYNLPVVLKANKLALNIPDNLAIKVLPPFGKHEIGVEIGKAWWPRKGSAKVELLANEQSFSYNIETSSLVLGFVLPVLCGLVVSGSLLLFVWKTRDHKNTRT